MKNIVTLSLGLLTALPVSAEPYCPALLDEAQLENRYKRLAPIHNDRGTGWIFTSDQMDTDYEMSAEAEMLMTQVTAQFAARGKQFAILVAPPRPLVAGQQIVDETIGASSHYDVAATHDSFDRLIEQLQQTGAIVPNLLDVALAHSEEAPYYFKRDTHWTSIGAAASALALAEELDLQVTYTTDEIVVIDTIEERGSLSDIVEATCGSRAEGESMPVYDYSTVQANGSLGLLDDTPVSALNATLLGTSFSDRYRRDQYQVADALSVALDATIENLSVSGGGLIGPIEEFILSDALSTSESDLIVWEFPYTETLGTSALRQLLGALMADGATSIVEHALTVSDDEIRHELMSAERSADVLHISLDTVEAQRLYIDLTFEDGTSKTVQLRRKASMQEVAQHADWWAYFGQYIYGEPVSLRLRIDPKAGAQTAQVSFLSTPRN